MTYLQRPLFDVEASWRPPNLLPEWPRRGRVAVDVETCDPDLGELGPGVRRDGFLVGISFAIEDGPSHYLPIAHAGGGNMDSEIVLRYLRDQAREFRGTIVGMNLQYDLDYLAHNGVEFSLAEWFRDVAIAAVLINELHARYALNDILTRAGLPAKSEEGLERAARAWCLHPKNDLWRLPARHVAEYAIGDVELPLALLRRQERAIEEMGLGDIWNLESRVVPAVLRIVRRGVRVDEDRLDQVCRWALGEEMELLRWVKVSSGVEIPPEHLLKKDLTASALSAVGVTLPPTPTGQPKTDADTLGALDHDVARWIVRAKKYHKMRTDFASSIRRHLVRGRIHANFRQVKGGDKREDEESGVAFGRFSCRKPNLQQQYNPEKEPEISGRWRQIFLPDEGAEWASCDFASQEPRLAVHYATLTRCRGAEAIAKKYREEPRFDLHGETTRLCEPHFRELGYEDFRAMRKVAKSIFLGLSYGMGGAKLCDSLGLETATWVAPDGARRRVAGDRGRALLTGFHQMVPFIGQLSKMCELKAASRGEIRTLLGRLLHFPRIRGKYEFTHKALNRLIQGSAADQGKKALVDADAAGFTIHVPVHDEFCASVGSRSDAEELARIMAEAVELRVPSAVDVEVGPSWGEAC